MVFFDEFAKAGIYLREVGGDRRFASTCGNFESTYLYNAIKNPPPDRPYIHTVMASAVQALGGRVEKALVDVLEDQDVHAKLHISFDERLISVDLRPTDAYVLAIICNAPIFITESVLSKMTIQEGN
jgi:bifunctional DNase/RNase